MTFGMSSGCSFHEPECDMQCHAVVLLFTGIVSSNFSCCFHPRCHFWVKAWSCSLPTRPSGCSAALTPRHICRGNDSQIHEPFTPLALSALPAVHIYELLSSRRHPSDILHTSITMTSKADVVRKMIEAFDVTAYSLGPTPVYDEDGKAIPVGPWHPGSRVYVVWSGRATGLFWGWYVFLYALPPDAYSHIAGTSPTRWSTLTPAAPLSPVTPSPMP